MGIGEIELSVVIPAYNSGLIVGELFKQLDDALQLLSYEVLIINDCSRDDTWDQIKNFSLSYSKLCIHGINLSKNYGQDNAIMAGLNYAIGSYIVIMDDDLQHSPHDIHKLLSQIKESASDICYGNYSANKNQKIWKNFGSFLNSKFAEFILKKPQGVYLSPFKIITKTLANEVVNYHGPYPYIDGLLLRYTNLISQCTVDHGSRFAGNSNYSLKKSFSVFLKHATGFSIAPLRFATAMGFIFSILGFVLAIKYLIEYMIVGVEVEGWTTLIVVNLLIGGILLFSIGMIGEYIGRIYLTVTNRPQYSIREIFRN